MKLMQLVAALAVPMVLSLAVGRAGSAMETAKPAKVLLGVFAHPDDETVCAGVLARAAAAGWEVIRVWLTALFVENLHPPLGRLLILLLRPKHDPTLTPILLLDLLLGSTISHRLRNMVNRHVGQKSFQWRKCAGDHPAPPA